MCVLAFGCSPLPPCFCKPLGRPEQRLTMSSMNFARDHLEKQFARELRMKQISKASDVERGAAAPRPKAWAKKESTRQALPKQPTTKPPKPPPKDLFDAAATLKILVGTSYDYAAERAEQLQLPAANACCM